MNIFTDKYIFIARYLPSIFGIIPIVLLYYSLNIEPFFINVISTGIISISLIYTYSLLMIRIPSKIFEDRIYSNGLMFPTTEILLYKNLEYQDSFKDNIRLKIQRDFRIKLLSKKDEIKDEVTARSNIKDAVKLIINRVKNEPLLYQHNCEYGFSRNLWSASIIGIVGTILLFIFSLNDKNGILLLCSIFLFCFYCIYLYLGKFIITYFGKLYARKLIEVYYEK